MDLNLKPYLTYSTLVHAGLVAMLFLLSGQSHIAKNQVYRIDFIGPTAGILNRELEAASVKSNAAASAQSTTTRPAPLQNRDEFAVKKKKRRFVLPRPSILGGRSETPKPEPVTETPPTPAPAASPSASGTSGSGAGISADLDMPNFPYPWYIAEVRSALWDQWSAHMPSSGGEVILGFAIMKSGNMVDLRVESSSGDRSFDEIALSAVQDSAPFAPLPREFPDAFLKVHVRFKSQGP